MKHIKLFFLFAVLTAVGCRDRYELPLKETDISLLVVEGNLNAGQGPTNITLSRTVKVNEAAAFKPVLQAKLVVEGKNGGNFPLTENGNGNYTHAQLPLVFGQEYRLRIQTADNKEYLSDYVVAMQVPPIDSITWKKENDRVIIYANTRDLTNTSRYYKWDYDETWEIRSYYFAEFAWLGGTTIVYVPQGYRDRCWKYAKSNTINIGTTAQLQENVVSEAPVQFINPGSEKLSVRYSILLKQQYLTKAAYEYFQLMKKNTEAIGSIFDPQPSELRGNIKCLTNEAEGVIGYLTASSITEKRFFLTSVEANWIFKQDCYSERVRNHPDSIRNWPPAFLPWGGEGGTSPGAPTHYFMAPAVCVDCTQRGGNLNMPSYW